MFILANQTFGCLFLLLKLLAVYLLSYRPLKARYSSVGFKSPSAAE